MDLESDFTPFGVVVTPFGDVRARPERYHHNPQEIGMACRGDMRALQWLFPKRKISRGADRLFLLPPPGQRNRKHLAEAFDQIVYQAAEKTRQQIAAAPAAEPRTLGHYLFLLEIEAKASLRPSTLVTYRHEWKGILSFFPSDTLMAAITRDRVQEMIAVKVTSGFSPATIRKHVVQLARLMGRAMDDRHQSL